MNAIFTEIFVRPIFNLLIAIYNALPSGDLGIAVILVVIIMRLFLWPLYQKAARSQMMFAKIQPEIEKIQKKFKHDKTEQTKQLLEVYRAHHFNPFSGMLVLLIQVPIILALYRVFLKGITNNFAPLLYSWVANPGSLNARFLNAIDLTKPFWPLVVLAAAAQFWQAKTLPQPKHADPHSFQAAFARQMIYLGPILTVAIFASFPSVIPLYWALTSVLTVGQQYLLERQLKKYGRT